MASRAMGPGDVYYGGKALQLPPEVTHQISMRAAEIVRRNAPKGPHNSRMKVRATNQKGQIGVYFPPDTMHLMMLDKGIKPFIMKNLEGKTIPIRTPGGVIFRRAKNVGGRQVIARDEKGNIAFSKIRWRHPGVQPMNFIQPAMEQAIREWRQSVGQRQTIATFQNMQGPVGKFFNRFKRVIPNAYKKPPQQYKWKS